MCAFLSLHSHLQIGSSLPWGTAIFSFLDSKVLFLLYYYLRVYYLTGTSVVGPFIVLERVVSFELLILSILKLLYLFDFMLRAIL